MRYRIQGNNLPSLDIELNRGESVFTEGGGMAWMRGNIEMSTNTRGGLMKGIMRSFAGESIFLTTYQSRQDEAQITFTPETIGSIITLELAAHETRICQKDAFMVAEDSIELSIHFKKRLGAGFFGGEGFILQKLTGPGLAWVEISGEVREVTLGRGEALTVDPGHVAMYEPSIDYDIRRVKGVRNMLFGGEGLFLAHLTGPGRVWLQTMPLSNLANRIAGAIGGSSSGGNGGISINL